MKRIYLILILIISLSINAKEFRLLLFSDYYGEIEADNKFDSLRQRTYIRPEFSMDILEYMGSFTLSAEYYYDLFAEESIPNPFNILREFYFNFYLPSANITIGQKYTNKGKVDVYSPLNLYNASYRELLSMDESYQNKRADLQLEVKYYLNDENSIELVYIPFPRPDYQGIEDLEIDKGTLFFTLDKRSNPYLYRDNSHSAYLTYSRYGFNWDIQLFYSNYIDREYDFDLSDLIETEGRLRGILKKEYNRANTFGAAFSTNIGSFALNEEIALNITEDFNGTKPGIKNSDLTINSQVTKTLFGEVTANVNLIYQYIFNYGRSETDFSSEIEKELIGAINDVHLQPTDHIAVVVLHLHDYYLREKLYVGLNSALLYPRIYIGPRINYKLKDYLTLETGIDYFTDKYENNTLEEDLGGDNFFIRIKYEL